MRNALQEQPCDRKTNWPMKNRRRRVWGLFLALAMSFFPLSLVGAEPPLVNGGFVEETISAGGEIDSYTFLAEEGQNVQIRVAETADSNNFFPRIDLIFVPTDALVASGNAPAGTVAALSTPTLVTDTLSAGTYRVEVYDGNSNLASTASYRLYFALVPGANDGSALTPNVPVQGRIDIGELDSYTFSANAGENVEIRVTETFTTGNFVVRFDIYGPTGTRIDFQANQTNAIRQLTAPETGTYTVVVADGNSNFHFEADYEIEFQCFTCNTPPLPPSQPNDKDLDANGTADIIWRNTVGDVAVWLGNGVNAPTSTGVIGGAPMDWSIAGVGDINGDGLADIIWRNTVGDVAAWLGNGVNAPTSTGVIGGAPMDWSIAGVGDINGDGLADIIWRNTVGDVAVWLGNGVNAPTSTGVIGGAPMDWSIAGVGDINGDGLADIIWRNTVGDVAVWLGNGVNAPTSTGVIGGAPTDWSIAGIGDINGDSLADIIWRNTVGDVAVWLGNGVNAPTSTGVIGGAPTDWTIAGVGDINGDGLADIIWRNTVGDVAVWLGNGVSAPTTVGLIGGAPLEWKIVPMSAHEISEVSPPVTITSSGSFPVGTADEALDFSLTFSGGTGPFTWSVIDGGLPAGVTLNPSTGRISGIPAAAGNFTGTIQVQDSGSPPQVAQLPFICPIAPATGGGAGSLIVSNGPSIIGGEFTPVGSITAVTRRSIGWTELAPNHAENLSIGYLEDAIGLIVFPSFKSFNPNDGAETIAWLCNNDGQIRCPGLTLNLSAGTATFANAVFEPVGGSAAPITLNGTLTFTPF